MQLAINEAWKYQFLTYPNPAVGACIVKNGKILSIGVHKKAGLVHAEVDALKKAYLKYYPNNSLKYLDNASQIHIHLVEECSDFFKDCTIYVTLEPCSHIGRTPSCATLLKNLKIKKVIIGALDKNKIASGGKKILKEKNIKTKQLKNQNCKNLLYPFKKWQKGNFVFFKIAIRENGSCDGGYITSQDSLNLVHNIRTKINLLVIGGKTVRVDKPTLDTRFSTKNKPPNVLIYSTKKSFDKKIPLFNIKNRAVTISNNLDNIKKNNFVMIEGGYNFLEVVKDKIDILMVFVSHKKSFDKKFDFKSLGFEKLHSYFLNKFDEIIYYKGIKK
jgi:diaminohydroxyphosphoribosylaminopyrimidine deaminase/5-amino-6-(5-phosphoribosylamino)uracil reductase